MPYNRFNYKFVSLINKNNDQYSGMRCHIIICDLPHDKSLSYNKGPKLNRIMLENNEIIDAWDDELVIIIE